MKLKHSAIIALAAWLGVVAWVGAMVVAKPTVFGGYASEEDGAVNAQLQQQIAHAVRMRDALSAMSAPHDPVVASSVVATPPPPAPGTVVDGTGMTAPAAPARVVSMILSGQRMKQRAVVDGELVQRGSELADGARVLAIGGNWVRIESPGGLVETLTLRSPYGAPARAERTP